MDAARLHVATEEIASNTRGYLLIGDQGALDRMRDQRGELFSALDEQEHLLSTSRALAALSAVRRAARSYAQAVDRVLAAKADSRDAASVLRGFHDKVQPRRQELAAAIDHLVEVEQRTFHDLERSGQRMGRSLLVFTSDLAVGTTGIAILLALLLARAMRAVAVRQKEIEQTNGRLQSINGDLDAFAGRIAHDLGNSLTPLALTADALRRISNDPAVGRIANRITTLTKRANDMVQGLLAFSRASRPDPGLVSTPAIVVASLVRELEGVLDECHISLTTDLDDRVRVACRESLLRQVVANIMSNAIKFMDDRERREIRVRVAAEGGDCRIQIEDSGPGIPADAMDRVSEPFYRAPGVNAAGTGIGLATVKRIVEAHDGRLQIASRVGTGTTVTVSLPSLPAQPTKAFAPLAGL